MDRGHNILKTRSCYLLPKDITNCLNEEKLIDILIMVSLFVGMISWRVYDSALEEVGVLPISLKKIYLDNL